MDDEPQLVAEKYNQALEDFKERVENYWQYKVFIFPQVWGNTSGGFQTIGGASMVTQSTVIFEGYIDYLVYFSGRFAYRLSKADVHADPALLDRFRAMNPPGIRDIKQLFPSCTPLFFNDNPQT